MVALITRLLEEKGKDPPVVMGECALSYYSREVYFTADIDLAYADREALNTVLMSIGFGKRGRYWVNEGLKMAIETPASVLVGEDAPVEIVRFRRGSPLQDYRDRRPCNRSAECMQALEIRDRL